MSTTGTKPLVGLDDGAAGSPAPSRTHKVRPPAVAGLFYPKEPSQLTRALDRFLAAAPERDATQLRALISPHAGYEYSGPVAAFGYKLLAGRDYRTVILLAASHYANFEGVSVPATDAYQTPLGAVPVSPLARELAKQKPFVLEPCCYVQRPQWSHLAPKPAPAPGEDTPETWEHSVEVQVPFLQRTLKDFAILPVMFGDADPAVVAQRLAPLVDDRTLVVTSTDLSHYLAYDDARTRDLRCVQTICDLDCARLTLQEACGCLPVLALMHLAKLKGWQPELLDYRNSGDTAGDKGRVVGYAAIGFFEPGAADLAPADETTNAAEFSAGDREFLLALARRTLCSVTQGEGLPTVPLETVPASCQATRGCFVTLTASGQLRGCIGNLAADEPLYQAVMDNARSAALRDGRFASVTAAEVDTLRIEISVLTEPRPLPFSSPDDLLTRLQPQRDGVVLNLGARRATFLPQVWEDLPNPQEFLEHLARKAGGAAGDWRGKEVSVSVYRVEAFEEAG